MGFNSAFKGLNWYCVNRAQDADLLGKDTVDKYKMCIRKNMMIMSCNGTDSSRVIARYRFAFEEIWIYSHQNIRRAQVKVGLINLCKGLFSLNARIYYKLTSGT